MGSDDLPAPRLLIGCSEAVTPERARELCLAVLQADPLIAVTGPELAERARTEQPDLILTAVDLPEEDGFSVVRGLRRDGDTVPVVFVTFRAAQHDVISGFIAGADDYIGWPFDTTELQLRIRALLRRSQWERGARAAATADPRTPGARGAAGPPVRGVGDIEMDTATRTVTRAGAPVDLSPTEYALLGFLMDHPRQVLSREQLREAVWGGHVGLETVETFVRYLRRKLDPLGPPAIHTRRGHGYVFDPDAGQGPGPRAPQRRD
ncbi:response regulator transcription factor [Streptomyces monticola]|uniref:Response regulator transcription factor n=1 Tax=Streptomyces monticola TaxID=2666263 RepID=A0ABW2JE02_9ACTN